MPVLGAMRFVDAVLVVFGCAWGYGREEDGDEDEAAEAEAEAAWMVEDSDPPLPDDDRDSDTPLFLIDDLDLGILFLSFLFKLR